MLSVIGTSRLWSLFLQYMYNCLIETGKMSEVNETDNKNDNDVAKEEERTERKRR